MSAIYVVMRLVHFVGGNVTALPVSFHKTEAEATSAKTTAIMLLGRRLKPQGAKELLQNVGIGAISFEVGEFRTGHEDLIQVPRLIVPPSVR